jgi:hypothetical protein
MQMCVDDQFTDLKARGVGTNNVIDFLPALENHERWHLQK